MYITNIRKCPAGYSTLVQKQKRKTESWLRNEVSLTFNVRDNVFEIIDGWIIGPDEIFLDKKDNDILEHFFPGLIVQLKAELLCKHQK